MEGHCSTDQSPQWAVVPMEEEEEVYETHFLLNALLFMKSLKGIIN